MTLRSHDMIQQLSMITAYLRDNDKFSFSAGDIKLICGTTEQESADLYRILVDNNIAIVVNDTSIALIPFS